VNELMPCLESHSSSMFDAADKNKSETIDLVEFLQMYVPYLSGKHARALVRKYGGALYVEEDLERERQDKEAAEQEAMREAEEDERVKLQYEIEISFDRWCSKGKSDMSFNVSRSTYTGT